MFDDLPKTIIAVMSNIFETMFFLSLEPCESDRDLPLMGSSTFLLGQVGFRGKSSGEIKLFLPLELASAMATNFLGLEEGTASEAQAMDVVGELCNMICGNLLSRLDKKTAYILSVPRTRSLFPKGMDEETPASGMAMGFDAEGHRIKLVIQFES